jgi:adenosylhomocysteine nucleosidase
MHRATLEAAPYRPRALVSAGFAGALQPGFRIGDIILATEVADPLGNRWPTTWPGKCSSGGSRPDFRRGRVLSAPHLVASSGEKLALGKQHDAVAVDMETATVARLCSGHDVPFGCVRAISDEVQTGLSPRLLSLLAGERVSPLRVLAALATTPTLSGDLWRLARHTRQAAQQLSIALGEMLSVTVPGNVVR